MTLTPSKAARVTNFLRAIGRSRPARRVARFLRSLLPQRFRAIEALNRRLDTDGLVLPPGDVRRADRRGAAFKAMSRRHRAILEMLRQENSPC